jgi:chlorosome envelope protein I
MTKVVINDEAFNAEDGELILDVARRNGAHIGFMCNGNGICTTCECLVQSGMDNLSPLSEVETQWLTEGRIKKGYRLGCQVAVHETGAADGINIITRAELLKRQFFAIFRGAPQEGESGGYVNNLASFVSNVIETTVVHVVMAPTGMLGGLNRIGPVKILYPWGNQLGEFLQDGRKVWDKELGQPEDDKVEEVK